jgi:hypothetical protein
VEILIAFLFFAFIAGGSRRASGRFIARPAAMMVISVLVAASFYSLRVVL